MPQTLSFLIIILSGLSFSVLALGYKQAAETQCRPMAFTVVFNTIAALVSIWRVCAEQTAWSDWRLWALGIALGSVLFIAQSFTVAVNRLGPMSVIWTMTNLSLLLPILLSRIFLNEALLKIDGLLLLLFATIIMAMRSGTTQSGGTRQAAGRLFWLLLALLYLCNGIFQFGNKLKEIMLPGNSSAAFAAIFYSSGAIMAFVAFVLRERSARISLPEWRAGALAGASSSVGCILLLHAMSMPVVVVFAVSMGVSLIGGVALTAMVYGERFNAGKIVGWILGLVMVALAVTREQVNAAIPW